MPVLAALLYWWRIGRRPIDTRLKRANAGGFLIAAGTAAVLGMWNGLRPTGLAEFYFWGELAGVLAVYALSCSLVTATRAHWLEPWFGGLDRMYRWHKRTAITGIALLIPHKLLLNLAPDEQASSVGLVLGIISAIGLITLVVVSLPRAGRLLRLSYERWLLAHRFTGLLVAIGVLHGLLIDNVVASSIVLRSIYLLIGVAGVIAYAYAELFMRRAQPTAAYRVTSVSRPDDRTVELRLRPLGLAATPRPGQFVYLAVTDRGGLAMDDATVRDVAGDDVAEHPFSVAGVGPGGELRLAIRALGDDTRRLHARLRPGQTAMVTGPFGMFDHTLGGPRQIWIAGGIGIAPFLGWLAEPLPEQVVDLFYSATSEPAAHYLPELLAATERLDGRLRVHPVFTDSQPRLTAAHITATIDGPLTGRHVFLCGPDAMTTDLHRDLHRAGVPRDHLHADAFTFR